jgi:hypothetical protein
MTELAELYRDVVILYRDNRDNRDFRDGRKV